ncbi:MAG: porin [Pseudomonadota bacterium]
MTGTRLVTAALVALPLVTAPLAVTAQDNIMLAGDDRVRVLFYGQVNRAILYGDNDTDSEFFFVDNDNSSTRFGIRADYEGVVSAGARIELELESNSSNDVSFSETSTDFELKERILEVYVAGEYGKLSLGQGSTASDGTSEADLSGTSVVGYSNISAMAGGLTFNNSDTAIKDAFSNFDGLGRDDRLRYDTPEFGGFVASASFGTDDEWDIALRYAAEFGGTELEAAIAYAEPDSDSVDDQINLSASILLSGGISFTLSAGEQSLVDTDDPDPQFYYVKLGYEADLFEASYLGSTAFAIDYYDGDDLVSGASSKTYGIFAVQNFTNVGVQAYIGLRNYELDGPAADDDIVAAMVGARLKF